MNKIIIIIILLFVIFLSCSNNIEFDFNIIDKEYIYVNQMKLVFYYIEFDIYFDRNYKATPAYVKENYNFKIIVNTMVLMRVADILNRVEINIIEDNIETNEIYFNLLCEIYLNDTIVYSYAIGSFDNYPNNLTFIWINGKYYRLSESSLLHSIHGLFIPHLNKYYSILYELNILK